MLHKPEKEQSWDDFRARFRGDHSTCLFWKIGKWI